MFWKHSQFLSEAACQLLAIEHGEERVEKLGMQIWHCLFSCFPIRNSPHHAHQPSSQRHPIVGSSAATRGISGNQGGRCLTHLYFVHVFPVNDTLKSSCRLRSSSRRTSALSPRSTCSATAAGSSRSGTNATMRASPPSAACSRCCARATRPLDPSAPHSAPSPQPRSQPLPAPLANNPPCHSPAIPPPRVKEAGVQG